MAVGEKGTVTIAVTVSQSAIDGTIENIGIVESDLADPDFSNNADDASVVLVAIEPPTTTVPPAVPETVAPAVPPSVLPRTGSNSTMRSLQLAAAIVLLGGIIVAATRRRTNDGRPENA
jgi:LPXTG-motif cell wall-anchored protein